MRAGLNKNRFARQDGDGFTRPFANAPQQNAGYDLVNVVPR